MKKIIGILTVYSVMFTAAFAGAIQEKNKQIVTAFYQKAVNEKNFNAAKEYLGPWYIQHNPTVKDGVEGFKQFIDYLKVTFPELHGDIKRVIADDDKVILHVHSIAEPGTRGRAIIDIFRLENGKIVEHWDVIQAIPAESANGNGMF